MKIGIIDSGIGGINVLNTLIKTVGGEFLYVADNAFAPYGVMEENQLNARIGSLCNYLTDKNVDCIVLACNTASLVFDRDEVRGRKIFRIVQDYSAMQGDALVLSTILSSEKLSSRLPDNAVSVGFHHLATDVENHVFDLDVLIPDLKLQLSRYDPDALFLACTHFIYLKKAFSEIFPTAKIYDGTENLPSTVSDFFPDFSATTNSTVKIAFSGRDETAKYKKILNNLA